MRAKIYTTAVTHIFNRKVDSKVLRSFLSGKMTS